jgi:hypothetical protein
MAIGLRIEHTRTGHDEQRADPAAEAVGALDDKQLKPLSRGHCRVLEPDTRLTDWEIGHEVRLYVPETSMM